ncbi:MAG TPA: response regulator [Rhizomicrobium sp.]|jgi:CheY-like chemotaxis protein
MKQNCQTVLVVDDDPLVRDVAKSILEAGGYTVQLACEGEAALRSLAAERADVVLLDILMPNKEGLETLLELKKKWPDIAVVAMSASALRQRNDFLVIAERFGADFVLRKPFTPEALIAAIRFCDRSAHGASDVRHG